MKNKIIAVILSISTLVLFLPSNSTMAITSTNNISQEYVLYGKDFDTGQEEYTTIKVNSNLVHDTESYMPDYHEIDSGISPNSVYGGTDTRQEIMNTYDFPYKAICNVEATWYNTKYGTVISNATGFMINKYYMLTAGHAVYRPEFGGYCDKVLVYPARNRVYAPYGPYKGVKVQVTNEYIKELNNPYTVETEEDWALVKLDSDVGSTTGYFGLSVSTNGYDLLQKNVSVTGYPSDKSDDCTGMWKGTGTVKTQTMYDIGYTCDTNKGDSGAPVYLSNNKVIAIHVRGISEYRDYNEGTKINSKVSSIINFLTM